MKWHRIYGAMLRYFYLFRRSFDRFSETFVHPVIDLILWGLITVYFQKSFVGGSGVAPFVIALVTAIIFWNIIWRTQMELPMSVLEDLWNRNLLNMFISPLRFSEWVSGILLMGLIKSAITLAVGSTIAFWFYHVNVFMYGFYFIPFLALLLLTGMWLGFLITGLILRFGTSFQALAWTLGTVIAPFSAVYYPLSILPAWAQTIGRALPTTYIFEGMREILEKGVLDADKLGMSFILNVAYLVVASAFLYFSFKNRQKRGLLNLD